MEAASFVAFYGFNLSKIYNKEFEYFENLRTQQYTYHTGY